MQIDVHHYIHQDAGQLARLEELMSKLSEKLDQIELAADAADTRIREDIAGLKAQIDDLQAQVDAGGVTDDELARLDALNQRLARLDPVPEIGTPPDSGEPTPTPEPEPTPPIEEPAPGEPPVEPFPPA